MNILALDLGTKTGYCYTLDSENWIAGTWTLASDSEITRWGKDRTSRRCDPRVFRLHEKLRDLNVGASVIVFEDVQFQTFTYQTQLWSSLRTAMWLAFPGATFEAVPVPVLKKFATGYGAATKESMLKALLRQYPGEPVIGLDDNAVDARWLYHWAQHNLGRRKP
jgi:hypothetical protein